MNILPKKSWHVLKKENIERVRRDEAKAAEEEKQKQARIALAEQEARTARLRQKARINYNEVVKQQGQQGDDLALVAIEDQPRGHINFFKDIQEGKKVGGVNADHEAEKQAEKINYEKKIGLLTYLGQSSAEAQTVKPWYQQSKRKLTNTNDKLTTEASTSVDVKRKKLLDPMEEMNQYLCKKSVSQCGQKMASDRPKPSVVQQSVNAASKVEQLFRTNDDAIIRGHHHRKEGNKRHRKHRKYKSSDDSDSEKKHKRHKSKYKKKHKKHHRKHRHRSNSSLNSSSEDSDITPNTTSNTSIEKLRAERLKRETAERARTERLLSGNTEETSPMSIPEKVESTRGRYNSQFHPELARKRHDRKNFYL